MSGIINLLMGMGGPTISLNGETITQTAIPATSHAGVRIDSDGKVYSVVGDGTSEAQIDTTTDWIRPLVFAPGVYHVRATINSGSLHAGSAAADTDHALTSDRQFYVERNTSGTSTANITVEIKLGSGGPVVASGVYALSCTTS